MERPETERRIARILVALGRRWRRAGDQVLAGLDVSDSSGWCLLHLSRLGPEARQADLARELEVREASLVRSLARLEELGLIQRSPNPKDARANCMQLTDKGQALVLRIEQRFTELRREILNGVNDAELAVLLRVCEAMDASFALRHC